MELLTLARRLRDESVTAAKQETGQDPTVEDIALIGGNSERERAFAVAFRVKNFDPYIGGTHEFTVTISETSKRS